MFGKTQKKAQDLVKELKLEIQALEEELAYKKQVLVTIQGLDRKGPGARKTSGGLFGRRGPGRPTARRVPSATRARTAAPRTQRKSKNRDAILGAAGRMKKGKFTLGELKAEIHRKDPKFGGKHPSGTILAALKNTPDIEKVGRGVYKYKRRPGPKRRKK